MDHAIRKNLQDCFVQQPLMRTLGAIVGSVKDGEVVIELPFHEKLTQHHGFFHAGVITTIMDNACGGAALSQMPANATVLTVEYKVNFLSPAKGDKLIARGQVLKSGRALTVCQGEVHVVLDGEEKLVATMLATMMCREMPGSSAE